MHQPIGNGRTRYGILMPSASIGWIAICHAYQRKSNNIARMSPCSAPRPRAEKCHAYPWISRNESWWAMCNICGSRLAQETYSQHLSKSRIVWDKQFSKKNSYFEPQTCKSYSIHILCSRLMKPPKKEVKMRLPVNTSQSWDWTCPSLCYRRGAGHDKTWGSKRLTEYEV